MVWGLKGALSVTVTVPGMAPVLVGEKVMLMVQERLGARKLGEIGQLSVSA